MNRTAILFLALAVLLAHMLAIHQSPTGEFAAPYDVAHVAFRLGRNLVHEGELAWNRGEGIFSSYPSLLWIGVAALAERFYVSPIQVAQSLGMACTLGSVIVLTQFSMKRRSGLIAPLLLAVSGCAAAAGTSGTEAPVSMFLLTLLMLAFERRRRALQVFAGVLLAASQPTATWPLVMLVVLELGMRPRSESGIPRPRALLPVLAPILALAVLMGLRRFVTGAWFTPTSGELVADPLGQLSIGVAYLGGFFTSSGSAPLLLFPVLVALGPHATGTGRRALLVTAAWLAGVAFEGGSEQPFWNAIAPTLPIFFLSIQDAVTRLMDRHRRYQPIVIVALLLGGLASMAVSKVPGQLGPLRIEGAHRAWMTPSETLRTTYGTSHGRLGLLEEIRRVERLRQVGLFLRDSLPKSTPVSTAWPGAIGYLSRRPVHDLLGRTNPVPGELRTKPWAGRHAVDVRAALEQADAYLVSARVESAYAAEPLDDRLDFLRSWLGRPADFSPEVLDTDAFAAALAGYESVSVPVQVEGASEVPDTRPAMLLRKADLALTPTVRLEREGDRVRVFVEHRGHAQVVDLTLSIVRPDGGALWMRPNGEWFEGRAGEPGPRARTDVLLTESGMRSVQLLETRLPAAAGSRIHAQLHDWGGAGRFDAAIGAPAVLEL